MNRAAIIMACVSATSAVAGAGVFALPARTAQGTYGKRIAGTMLCALAVILALFAWGLTQMAPGTVT